VKLPKKVELVRRRHSNFGVVKQITFKGGGGWGGMERDGVGGSLSDVKRTYTHH